MKEKFEPLVSIIIPTYGRPLLLDKAINSILTQNYNNYELIIVDDNNPNTKFRKSTEDLMDNYKGNPKIIYLKHNKNMNASAARNTGIRKSSGNYLCFLDDDDQFISDKLRLQVSFLEEKDEYQAVYCGWEKDGNLHYPKYFGKLSKELLLLEYEPRTSSIMFRRETIFELGGFDDAYKRHQDYELMLRFFKENTIGYVNEILLICGKNDGENMLQGEEFENLKIQFLSQFNYILDELKLSDKNIKNKVYAKHSVGVFINHLKNKNLKRAIKVSLCVLKKYPIDFFQALMRYTRKYIQIKFL